jgi:hypothetical protein
VELLALAPEVQSTICLVSRIAFKNKNERKNTLPASFMQRTLLLQILPEKSHLQQPLLHLCPDHIITFYNQPNPHAFLAAAAFTRTSEKTTMARLTD